ncbi:neutral/alkaline non-lysosomal ceramidase N-terminal domain-containing protein [Paenibacillus sp. OV219]|uniref:neutral/alkaline non-lysosomal ceramidase N-terminal domain-containing protein n=1 Tax=Paenibacillus sp. OV219 TaxID=1884377 RepID=UPI0008B3EB61|nr:neutral/alkaline non-lysosomal ceramidase N-terminal domain-containing protein [Paenibacillus sp. OV219]SEO04964.1 Neutral/alkaline non-lysosomal ceramidase, N-terminal [Paenibacillus sp. OV219]
MGATIRAGAWRTCITPPLDVPIAGGFFEIRPTEVLDDLYASALVIDDGVAEVALVSVDICFIGTSIITEIADAISEKCGIAKTNILLTATHTHKSPELMGGGLRDGQVNREEQDFYLAFFKKSLVTSVIMAQKQKQPVRIGVGRGENKNHVFNRRLRKPDGSIVVNWVDRSFTQDCIADGVIDPEMTVIRIDRADGEPAAIIVNYALHNNAITDQLVISADLSGYMSSIIRKVYGDDVVVLFLPGACGEINWIDYRDFNQVFDLKLFKQIGTGLAGTVLQIMPMLEYPEIADIGVLHEELIIPDRPYNDYDDKPDTTFGPVEGSRDVFEFYRSTKEANKDKALPLNKVDIHAIRLGQQIAIATNPAELFVEYGLAIKERSPFKYTLISELTNGNAGYACTRAAFEEGGYEVRKSGGSHMDIAAGERIVETSVKLLRGLL